MKEMVKDHVGHKGRNDEMVDERTMGDDHRRYTDHSQTNMKNDCYVQTAMKQQKGNQRERDERERETGSDMR